MKTNVGEEKRTVNSANFEFCYAITDRRCDRKGGEGSRGGVGGEGKEGEV